ncbi:MAG TPA: class I poly(R)-hydroxyalkanoic acid synthase, partial [Dehalococcoidia bacterium]|nr:class I poly(R)-hydroxyalkanoic acid synthase [Dehalococcoidia bacterium]
LVAATAAQAAVAQGDVGPKLKKLAEVQGRYLEQLDALRQTIAAVQSGGASAAAATTPTPSRGDPRFKAPEWHDQSYFDLLRQAYLAGSSFLHDLVNTVELDPKTRGRLEFLVRQYTDAVSPANFLSSNPEAVNLALETKGESLTAGLKNLFDDLAKGQLSMTDPAAFAIGRNLACTPGAVVFENELIQVLQYAPLTDSVHERPLLVVPPCINRFYVLDLQAENSFVRYAVSQGYTVFLISWRSVTPEIAHLTWDDYLAKGVLSALEVARDVARADQVHALGFCIGGTLLSCAAAVLRGLGEDPFASLTLLTTLLDFAETGDIGLMVDENLVRFREATIGRGGILSGRELASVFSMLRANDLVWPYVVNNYLKGRAPQAFDILFWNADSTNLPGPMVCWYLRQAYLENRIRVPGGTLQCGVPVHLSRIDMPVYLLAAREDHIVPWRSAFATGRLVSGEVRFVLGASGHIAGVINPPSRAKRSYWVEGEQGIGPETWLETAREVPGSWWTDWSRWLRDLRSKPVPAPARLGSNRFPPLEPAPGRYVKVPLARCGEAAGDAASPAPPRAACA